MAATDGAMGYWYNLAFPVRGTVGDVPGMIERIEDLSTDYVLKKASIKTKKKKTVAKDIYDKAIIKKKKTEDGKTVKKKKKVNVQYIKAKLEKQEMTFRVNYHVATGTLDVLGKIEEIKSMIGSSGPLVLGRTHPTANSAPRVFGMYEMRLTKVGVDGMTFDDLGRAMSATVNFTLTQVKKKKFKKQSAKFPGQSAKEILKFWCENPDEIPKQYESAVKISPDRNVKKMWKKRQQDKKNKKKKKK